MHFWVPFVLMLAGFAAGVLLGNAGHLATGAGLAGGSLLAWLIAIAVAARWEARAPAAPAGPARLGVRLHRDSLRHARAVARASGGRWRAQAGWHCGLVEVCDGADEVEALEWLVWSSGEEPRFLWRTAADDVAAEERASIDEVLRRLRAGGLPDDRCFVLA